MLGGRQTHIETDAETLKQRKVMRATVVVHGDLGRSPRMQYHVRSLLRRGIAVDFVGLAESSLVEELQMAPLLKVHGLRAFPLRMRSVFLAPFKALWMTLTLFWTLLVTVPRPTFVLVQNPPSIPTLFVSWLVARLRGAKLIVDWHNFGHTILALHIKSRWLLWLAEQYERRVGRCADAHLCVSRAMQEFLQTQWGIPKVVVLHDCPPEFFRRAMAKEKAALWQKEPLVGINAETTAVAVTATSYTRDEDLGMLLDGVALLDAKLTEAKCGTQFALLMTGRGDARPHIEERIASMKLTHCRVYTTYFESFADYACMLGSSSIGISMHASSSGFDLPMKVVDMFGCQLPVLSIHYSCIDELVQHNVNGLIFRSAQELAQQLFDLFREGPTSKQVTRLRNNIKIRRWDDTWNGVAWPVILRLVAETDDVDRLEDLVQKVAPHRGL